MRILLTRRITRSENGATAILVSLLVVVLVTISAFTVDFGQAYVSKRQLQTATDAASLAAAASYEDEPGSCSELALLPKTEAQDIAEDILEQNLPGATPGTLTVECSDDAKSLDVTYDATAATPVIFGGVAGAESQITTHREATATLSAPDSAMGVRPYMVCSQEIPASPFPETAVRVDFPKKDTDSIAGCPYASGNWFTVDCPEDNNNCDLDGNTLHGCEEPIGIVSPQDDTSPAALRDSLLEACDPIEILDPDCLTANPGDPNGQGVRDAWDTLMGEDIILPVFCGATYCDDPNTSDVEAAWEGNGNNTGYPVYRLAGVKVCGWHWGPKNSDPYDTLFPAAPAEDPCKGTTASAGGSNANYLMLAYAQVMTSGTIDPASCALEICTTRRVLLSK